MSHEVKENPTHFRVSCMNWLSPHTPRHNSGPALSLARSSRYFSSILLPKPLRHKSIGLLDITRRPGNCLYASSKVILALRRLSLEIRQMSGVGKLNLEQ